MGILWYTLGLALTPPFLSLLHDGRRICGDWRLAQPATGFCRGPRARDSYLRQRGVFAGDVVQAARKCERA